MPPAAPLPVPAAAAPAARAPEPEEEPVTVEKRGARPPSSFVLTGQLAYGSRKPRWEDTDEWEPVALTPTALPPLVLEESDVAYLKIDGESVPGTVGEPRAVAGDLMTILVVRAAPSLLPGLMELPKGPEAEPNDWGAFKLWVRERQRQQDGPDPAEAVEMPAIAPRWSEGALVQALFGADRYWPNPKTYIVYPTRELVRRPLLQHADLPAGQDTVPLLVTRQYEAAHRRVLAEWNPADGSTSIPSAGAVPADVAPPAGAPAPGPSQLSKPAAPTLPSPPQEVGERVATPAGEPRPHRGHNLSGPPPAMGEPGSQGHFSGGSGHAGPASSGVAIPESYSSGFSGGMSTGPVLPRFGLLPGPAQERPLVVLHRQPPVARMVTLALEPADREAGPAPAPPMVAAEPQPEIRHTPSGHPAGRFGVALRMPSMVGLTGTERDSIAAIRGDENSMDWSWTSTAAPAVPVPKLGLRRARVPVPRTAVRLAGADRAFELFLSPAPVDFTANVDQWSAL
jgi:hypothetical protein